MPSPNLHDLRFESDQASLAHLRAHQLLMSRIEMAQQGTGAWPTSEDYAAVAAMGRAAADALRRFLDSVQLQREQSRTRSDRVRLIQRLSCQERSWQPSPEDWLRSQDEDLARRQRETPGGGERHRHDG